jgi:dihydrofolate reductase
MGKVIVIAAITTNHAIGKNNYLVVKIKADMTQFKSKTIGNGNNVVIMGRKNLDSMQGKLLPNRKNIIITRDKALTVQGAYVAHSLEEALTLAKSLSPDEIYIIGGGEIYKQALASSIMIDELDITHINKHIGDADVFFPYIDEEVWTKSSCSEVYFTEKGTQYYFAKYEKK